MLYSRLVPCLFVIASCFASTPAHAQKPTPAEQLPLSAAVDLYFANAASGTIGAPADIAWALVRHGDLPNARRAAAGNKFMVGWTAGYVAAYTPGAETLAGAKKLAGNNPLYLDRDALIGLIAGLAAQKRFDDATAMANKADEFSAPTAFAIIASAEPSRQKLEQYLQRFPAEKLEVDDMKRIAKAAVVAGHPTLAKSFIDVAAKSYPNEPNHAEAVRGAIISVHLREDSRTTATTLAKDIKYSLVRLAVDVQFAREPARSGNVVGVRKAAETAKSNPEAGAFGELLVYAEARAGNIAAAQKLCENGLTQKDSRPGVRYGLLAAGLLAAGKKDEANAAIAKGIATISQLKEPQQRASGAAELIVSAAIGVDFYSYPTGFSDRW